MPKNTYQTVEKPFFSQISLSEVTSQFPANDDDDDDHDDNDNGNGDENITITIPITIRLMTTTGAVEVMMVEWWWR